MSAELIKQLRDPEGVVSRSAVRHAMLEAADRIESLERQLAERDAQAKDAERLDWLDEVNRKTNERNGTRYGWKFDINHNRAALMDHNWPAKSIREAIDAAMSGTAHAGEQEGTK